MSTDLEALAKVGGIFVEGEELRAINSAVEEIPRLRLRVHNLTNALRRTQTAAKTMSFSLGVMNGAFEVLDERKDGLPSMTFDESELNPKGSASDD